MTSSLKIGAVSGLIAGFVAGIVAIVIAIMILTQYGAPAAFYLPPPPKAPILGITTVEVVLGLIWGVGLGAIYSRFHDRLPGKGVKKGLVYGLLLYFIFGFRSATILANSAFYLAATRALFSIHPIVYGLVLGILYGRLRSRYHVPDKKLEISKYDVKDGIRPGAIAGLVGGIAAYFGLALGPILGLWKPMPVPPLIHVAGLMTQDMSWGILFGVLFVFFYSLVPGKGIMKGLCFSLIFYFMTSFWGSAYLLAYALLTYPGPISQANFWGFGTWTFSGFFHFVAFGLVLGALYRKPSD